METKEINETNYYNGYEDGIVCPDNIKQFIDQLFATGMTDFYVKAYKEYKESPLFALVSHWSVVALQLGTKDTEIIAKCGSIIYAWWKTGTKMTPEAYVALNLLKTKYPDKFREIIGAEKKTLEVQNHGKEEKKEESD